MEFINDISTLRAPTNVKFGLGNVVLPTNKDVYFRTKQDEIVDQYAAARLFLRETETDDWAHWFNSGEDKTNDVILQKVFISYFYEASLMYYNIVVDLTWALCYSCAEFSIPNNDKIVEFEGSKSIEEAFQLLRTAENLVISPTAESNPFRYLQKMCPEYSDAIQLITDFWKLFSSSPIRKKYNFCKHKGKPVYKEIEDLKGRERFYYISTCCSNPQKTTRIASDIRDVKCEQSLSENIDELKKFDDEQLFPYVKSLLEELEKVVDPSPLVM